MVSLQSTVSDHLKKVIRPKICGEKIDLAAMWPIFPFTDELQRQCRS